MIIINNYGTQNINYNTNSANSYMPIKDDDLQKKLKEQFKKINNPQFTPNYSLGGSTNPIYTNKQSTATTINSMYDAGFGR